MFFRLSTSQAEGSINAIWVHQNGSFLQSQAGSPPGFLNLKLEKCNADADWEATMIYSPNLHESLRCQNRGSSSQNDASPPGHGFFKFALL